MDQDEPHLLGDRREGVAHYLEPDRVERHTRSTTTAPDACTAPRHPGSISAVASRPARIAGPSSVTPGARSSRGHRDAVTRFPPLPLPLPNATRRSPRDAVAAPPPPPGRELADGARGRGRAPPSPAPPPRHRHQPHAARRGRRVVAFPEA